jgi:pimeloyl-ACP methyl ester carboxylesterase
MPATLVLVPGSFGRSEMYDPVVLPLREKGYAVYVLDPPCYPKSFKAGVPPPSMFDDAKFIAGYVEDLVDRGEAEDVVVMAHSYGGEWFCGFFGVVCGKRTDVERAEYEDAGHCHDEVQFLEKD